MAKTPGFAHLFQHSTDAQAVFSASTLAISNEAFDRLFPGITSLDALFALAPEFQPNGERSNALARQLLDEAQFSGSVRFEWLHEGDTSMWMEYVLTWIEDARQYHLVVRDITEYKAADLRTKDRIERLILQNEAITELTALESDASLRFESLLEDVSNRTLTVLGLSRVIIWQVERSQLTVEHERGQSEWKLPGKIVVEKYPRFKMVLDEHLPVVVNDVVRDSRVNELLTDKQARASLLLLPVINEGHLRSLVWMERWDHTGTWELEEQSFASAISELLAKHVGIRDKRTAEFNLEKQEKVFKALIDHSLDVVCIIDKNGKFTYQSPSFFNLMGYSESLVGKSSFEFIHDEDRKKLGHRFYKLISTPASENAFTFRARHKNGSWRYIDALARNLLEDSAISGVVVNFRDITERMTFQKQLRIKEQYYRTLIEKSLDITATRDERGITTYVSPSIETVFGISDSELLGKKLNVLIHPDDLEQAEKDWKFIIDNPGVPLNFEQRIVLANGDIRYVEGTARNLLNDSSVKGVVSNFRDTTAKHDTESALIDSQLRLEGIVSSAMDAIITVGQDHKIVLFNTAAETMFDFKAFEIFGKDIGQIFNKSTYNRFKEEATYLDENPMGSRKLSLKKKRLKGKRSTGERFPIDASLSRQEIDNEVFYTTIIRDISEQIKSEEVLKNYNKTLETEVKQRTKQLNLKNTELNAALNELQNAQEQLIESEKMASLGQLTAGIAHEINNPINFVSSMISPLKRDFDEIVDLIESKKATKEELQFLFTEIKQLLDGVEEGAVRTKNIVLGLRKFSRLDEDAFKKVDIHEGLDSTLMLLNSKLRGGIEVVKRYGKLPPVECLPGKINQVFMNILSNAIQAIQGNGTITITTRKQTSTVSISIEDTGVGMTEAVQKRIFEPFYTTKDVGVGTGLGLSITYGILENHNGKITVKSTPGEGTKFVISLPVSQL